MSDTAPQKTPFPEKELWHDTRVTAIRGGESRYENHPVCKTMKLGLYMCAVMVVSVAFWALVLVASPVLVLLYILGTAGKAFGISNTDAAEQEGGDDNA